MEKRHVKGWVFVAILLAVFASPTRAEQENFKVITAPEVKNMMEQGDTVLVHVLSRLEYGMQHIADSINIPVNKIETTGKLPVDKNTPLIFYCMGHK